MIRSELFPFLLSLWMGDSCVFVHLCASAGGAAIQITKARLDHNGETLTLKILISFSSNGQTVKIKIAILL